jgi:hypothetical protein
MSQISKETYKKIIHVKECLKEERKFLETYDVIDYVFSEYIKQESIDKRQKITKKY